MPIPRKTQAAILTELKKPLVVTEIELPEELSCGQVLVEIHYSGICGSQLGEIDGVKGQDPFLPHLLGHEGSGIVLRTGPGVTTVKENDRVVLHWMKGNGIDAHPPHYFWNGNRVNAGWVTTFNEYAIISENRLTPIPDWVDGNVAALLGCAITTGLGVITNNANVKPGESVVVFGAGGVGLNVIQGARLVSAYPIIGIDLYQNRLHLAAKTGATHCINATEQRTETALREILGTRGADVVIDNTGNPTVIRQAYDLLSPRGRLVLVGVPPKGKESTLYTLPLHFGKQITGSFGGNTKPSEDIPRYLKLMQQHILSAHDLITHECTLNEVNDAVAMMRSGELAGRCVIRMQATKI